MRGKGATMKDVITKDVITKDVRMKGVTDMTDMIGIPLIAIIDHTNIV